MQKSSNAIIQNAQDQFAIHQAVRVKMIAFHAIEHHALVAFNWFDTLVLLIALVTTFSWQQC